GSGLRLAMRDMEIRGAGNLLGPQQHGDMAAVGVETYSRLLNEEIQKLKGEEIEASSDGPLLELGLNAYIPEDYLPSESERVQTYKRILAASADDLEKIKEELVDRCGPLPAPAKALCDAASVRLAARRCGVSEIREETDGILVFWRENYRWPEDALRRFMERKRDGVELIPGPPQGVRITGASGDEALDAIAGFFRDVFDVAVPVKPIDQK
ncbi:MAG: hypothetical protein JO102_07165, partial [Elusimicrobia bacterium]|nr:hypothetical protein [Elusimicrobiota bacterium]